MCFGVNARRVSLMATLRKGRKTAVFLVWALTASRSLQPPVKGERMVGLSALFVTKSAQNLRLSAIFIRGCTEPETTHIFAERSARKVLRA